MWQFLKALWKSPRPDRSLAACMALHEAVRHGDLTGARSALSAGADPNLPLAMDENGTIIVQPDAPTTVLSSSLHLAIEVANLAMVRLLMQQGGVVQPEDLRLAVRRLSERTDGTIGPRGQVLLELTQHSQKLDFQMPLAFFNQRKTLADVIRSRQPALADQLSLSG